MKILVTGVAGFIGSNFLYYILEKYPNITIIGLDKLTYAGNLSNLINLPKEHMKRFKFYKGDIIDIELLKQIFSKEDIQGVINFAAESHVDKSIEDPQIFLKTNVLGTQSLLKVCKDNWFIKNEWKENHRFLQISTDEVYGSLGPTGYFTEKTSLNPRSPYSASKASADLLAEAYYHTYGMPILITRCSNNYGPFQFPEKLIPFMINNALNHKNLPVYGDGKQVRDWLYVTDHCSAIDLIFHKGKNGEVYNIGGHNERENLVVVKTIIDTLRRITKDEKINDNLIKHVEDRLGHDRRYGIDPTKIINELGWKPLIFFDDGLEKTINWYITNKEWLDKIKTKEYLKLNKELTSKFQ